MSLKKTPMRKCLGCNEMFPQKQLVRVVKTKIRNEQDPENEEFEISLDLVGKKNGRGAYVCKKSECLLMARKARRIERALSCQIPDEIYDKMQQEMSENE